MGYLVLCVLVLLNETTQATRWFHAGALFLARAQDGHNRNDIATQMIAEGKAATLRVAVSGSLPRYQWFKGGKLVFTLDAT